MIDLNLIAEWKRVTDAASPGPWPHRGNLLGDVDAAFVVAARQAIPLLLAERESLLFELEVYQEMMHPRYIARARADERAKVIEECAQIAWDAGDDSGWADAAWTATQIRKLAKVTP